MTTNVNQVHALETAALIKKAQETLVANDLGGYTVPTHGLYPFQWNWDSAITALGWKHFDEPRAWQEIEVLFDGQWDNGMVPHILFHQDSTTYFPGPDIWGSDKRVKSTSISQPPVVATVMKDMLDSADDKAFATEKVKSLFSSLVDYHLWWYKERDPLNTGLVVSYHPWESGMDNSPAWDEALNDVPCVDWEYERRDLGHVNSAQRPHKSEYDRFLFLVDFFKKHKFDSEIIFNECPYKVNDVGIISILHRGSKDILALGETLGVEDARLDVIAQRIALTESAINTLWCPDAEYFYCRNVLTDTLCKVRTSAGMLTVFAGLADEKQKDILNSKAKHWNEASQFCMASTHPEESRYEPQRYWRGPIWLHINWMIALGFEAEGFQETADKLRNDCRALVDLSGYYEYFNPETGEGCGGKDFSWTAAIALHWLL
ncbi:MGH1-like glycoside hydrolase domain-containing protein [Paraglaciecola chathamensis]|uniref:MGH1-like glycoside hydrolase domain-containing protein n=1 Tax=Paraglaciecola chathamensis TaxID=368405 RepID=UPI0026FC7678|nr:trehalase family glycosidase [Paraglaciecola chathamensis]MDO6560602.1 trehalase family glycosidase [Paraglaciecola chathamensis]